MQGGCEPVEVSEDAGGAVSLWGCEPVEVRMQGGCKPVEVSEDAGGLQACGSK